MGMKNLLIIPILSISSIASATMEQNAYNHIYTAAYKQSGLETNINNYVDKTTKHYMKYIPKFYQNIGSDIYVINKIVTEKKVTYEWKF